MPTARIALATLLVSLVGPAVIIAQQPSLSMPPWLTAFPGSSAEARNSGTQIESSYTAAASLDDVIAHYRRIFRDAGKPVQANFDGMGMTMRGASENCDLLIIIRDQTAGAAVRIVCSVRTAAGAINAGAPVVSTPSAAGSHPTRSSATTRPISLEERMAQGREHERQVLAKAKEDDRARMREMEKFDKPVYPKPKAPAPKLAWPSWLVHVGGEPLAIEKGTDRVRKNYLRTSFVSALPRPTIQAFYADLLNANGFPVYMRSLDAVPLTQRAWVEGAKYPSANPGPRLVLHIDITPFQRAFNVEIRLTAYP